MCFFVSPLSSLLHDSAAAKLSRTFVAYEITSGDDVLKDLNRRGKLAVNKIRKLPEGTTNDVPRTGSRKTQAKRENKKRSWKMSVGNRT